MQIKLIGLNGRYTHSTLSIFYLRQALQRHLAAATITLHQYTINDNYFETLTRIADQHPDCICFSAYIWNAGRIAQLVVDLQQILPQAAIILGGPEAQAMVRQHGLINITLVKGEVEGLSAQFYDDLAQARLASAYEAAPHPSFALPYRDRDFQHYLAHRHVYYESSRGCPYGCAYCLSAASQGVRHLEMAQVKDELGQIMAHQPHTVRFIDRTFNTLAARAMAIWEFLLRQPGQTCFHFEIAPERFTPEMYDFLAQVPPGRFQFEIGLQSTNPAALQAVNRQPETKEALATIQRLAAQNNIHIHADLILGLPQETARSFANGFNALFASQPHYIQMGLLKVLPATPLAQQKKELGLVHRPAPPYELLASQWLSHEQLSGLYWLGETVEKFYNCHFFKPLWHYLAQQNETGFTFFQQLMTSCQEFNLFKRAATEDLMSQILQHHATHRPDQQLIIEILQYCWLASGHKRMAQHLPTMDLKKNRDHLFATLPAEWPGLYQRSKRNHFFRKTVFASFSANLMRLIGHQHKKGYLAFGQETKNNSTRRQVKIMVLNQEVKM